MIPILQNRKIQILILIALLLFVGFQTGFISGTIVVEDGTINHRYEEIKGTGELLGPRNRTGYIKSYLSTGYSEDIVVQGTIAVADWSGIIPITTIEKTKYIIYGGISTGFFNVVNWEEIARPGQTTTYVYPPAQEYTLTSSWTFEGGEMITPRYDLNVIGNKYSAIRAEFWVYADFSPYIPLTPGPEWVMLSEDEAYLYSGWGGLYYHNTYEELNEIIKPRQTYEIGEEVTIDVWTNYGGQTLEGTDKTWSVKLRQPSDRGGAIIQEQAYNDDVRAEFKFTITEDMFSTSSNNEHSIELYNTWMPKAMLRAYAIDLIAKAPSDVTFDGSAYAVGSSFQTKVGEQCTIGFSANVNPSTQFPIGNFRVSVVYSTSNELLPTEGPEHPIWLVYTTDINANNGEGSISFTPTKEDYVTVFVNAQDSEGRTNLHPTVFTLWAYEGSTPQPDDVVDDETGEHDYWGGHTPDWMPWKPRDTAWEDAIWVIVAAMMSLLVFVILTAITLIIPIPVGPKYVVKAILVAIIAVISYLVFYYLMSDLSILADIFM